MTFIVMIPMIDCVLFGADRATTVVSGRESKASAEQVVKLVEAKHGFITGNGFAEILLPVKEAFKNAESDVIRTLAAAIDNTHDQFRSKYTNLRVEAEEKISTTSWFFSFMDSEGPAAGAYDKKTRNLIGLPIGGMCTSFPVGIPTSCAEAIDVILENRSVAKTVEAIQRNITLITEAASVLREYEAHVSEILDFVIHHRDYRRTFSLNLDHSDLQSQIAALQLFDYHPLDLLLVK